MKPRPYQATAIQGVLDQLQKVRSTLVVLPTGCGKTVVASHVIRQWPQNQNVLFLSHREEINFQTLETIKKVSGEIPQIEMGSLRADLSKQSRIVIGSIQTFARERRRIRFPKSHFGLIVFDEAHRATSASYREAAQYFHMAKIMGLTATPKREDGVAMGSMFDTVAINYRIWDAVEDGYLVPVRQQYVHIEQLDFSKLHSKKNDFGESDFSPNELDVVLKSEAVLHKMIGPTIDIAGTKSVVFFAASVRQAEMATEIFNRHKAGSAFCVHGKTNRQLRRRMLKSFESGGFQYLVNCQVLVEGWDSPAASVIVMGRPTKSSMFYTQAIGRGLRPSPPKLVDDPALATAKDRKLAIANSCKPDTLVLDYVGNSGRHKLVSTADILGGEYPEHVAYKAIYRAKEKSKRGESVSISEELQKAMEEYKKRAQAKREVVVANVKYKVYSVDPFEALDVSPVKETANTFVDACSDGQAKFLSACGVDPSKLTKRQASNLIAEIIRRNRVGQSSFRQIRLLKTNGIDGRNWSRDRAGFVLDQIFKKKPIPKSVQWKNWFARRMPDGTGWRAVLREGDDIWVFPQKFKDNEGVKTFVRNFIREDFRSD